MLNVAIHLSIFPLSASGMTAIHFQKKNGAIASLILVIEQFAGTIQGLFLWKSNQGVTEENSSISAPDSWKVRAYLTQLAERLCATLIMVAEHH